MKHLVMVVLFIIGVTTMIGAGETRTTTNATAYQRFAQPQFLDFIAEYDLVPVPNSPVSFQNPVRIKNINYPWLLVESISAPPARQPVTETWVNMEFISMIRKRR